MPTDLEPSPVDDTGRADNLPEMRPSSQRKSRKGTHRPSEALDKTEAGPVMWNWLLVKLGLRTDCLVMWNWLLVKLGLRTDWMNPDLAPPAFEGYTVHEFSPFEGISCCGKCGGGRLHKVHNVEAVELQHHCLEPQQR